MYYGAGSLLVAADEHRRIQLLVGTMGGAFAGVKQLEDARNLFGIGAYNIALSNTAHVIHFAVVGGYKQKKLSINNE